MKTMNRQGQRQVISTEKRRRERKEPTRSVLVQIDIVKKERSFLTKLDEMGNEEIVGKARTFGKTHNMPSAS